MLESHRTVTPSPTADILTARVVVCFVAGTDYRTGELIEVVDCTLGEAGAVTRAFRCGPACHYSPTALVADNCHTFYSRLVQAEPDLLDLLAEQGWQA